MRSNRAILGGAAGLLLASIFGISAIIGSKREAASLGPTAKVTQTGAMKAGAFDPAHEAPDFALPGSDGSNVTLARYRGKIVLLTFGFTYCPAVCPTTLATLGRARKSLGKEADQVQVIFVTVDPARDNAVNMRTYLAAFDRTFIGATGKPEALAAVRKSYGVTAEKQSTGADYAMNHTTSIFLIDRAGKLRAMMPYGHNASDFVHDIKLLLAN